MDIIWNKSHREKLISYSQVGQTTVEYILLFAIVTVIALSIFKSTKFNELFGREGTLVTEYRKQAEFSYRHGYALDKNNNNNTVDYRSGAHPSYRGRFFSAQETYP